MWYHPAAFAVGIRDVIAAWIVCLTIFAALFAFASLENTNEAGGAAAVAASGAASPTIGEVRRCVGPNLSTERRTVS